MDFGIIFANVGPYVHPEAAITMGTAAEANGFESIWTVEHPIVPKGYVSEYPYSRDGRMPGDEMAPIPDPLVWLTWVGAHTTTLKLGTGVMILPQRNPGILAKECATLDMLTGGRLLLGIGVGWLHEEFDALGVSWDDRAARTDDDVAALRALWEQEVSTHRGTHNEFTDVYSFPKPTNGTIPIVVGGHSKPAARRAGRLGNGFFPADPRHLPDLLPVMRAAAVEAGRDPDAIEITTGGMPTLDGLKALADMGVTRFVVPPLSYDPSTLHEALEKFAEQFIGKL
jgi:probable F420-dependent oxidoreductase